MNQGYFPLPRSPIGMGCLGGFGDFVPGGFPLPQSPVGTLPKSPDLTQSMLELLPDSSDCGMGCGCDSCSGGMGDIAVPAWAMALPAPLNSSMMGFPVVYAGLIVAVLWFMNSKKGRR